MILPRLFRFHLLTAVFAMLVAGGVLSVNYAAAQLEEQSESEFIIARAKKSCARIPTTFQTKNYGWPVAFVKVPAGTRHESEFLPWPFVLNLSVLLATVLTASATFEFLLFRRTPSSILKSEANPTQPIL